MPGYPATRRHPGRGPDSQSASLRLVPSTCYVRRTRYFSSSSPQLSQQHHHLHIVRIRGVVVLGDLHVQLWSLEDQWNAAGAAVGEEPAECLAANLPVTDQHVAVLVRAEGALAVVQVEEARRLACLLLERVEHLRQPGLRRAEVVATREEMARIQPVAGARAQALRHVREDGTHLFGGPRHGLPRPGGVLHEQARV